jgi:predicted HD phosphohydrolase
MDIDRRAFLASLGGIAVVEAMDDEAKAEALEHYLTERLDLALAPPLEGDAAAAAEQVVPAPPEATARRGVGSLFVPRGPAENRRMPELAVMPAKPTLVDFFNLRWAPANHVLQSATRALKTGMSEETILACLMHDVVQNLIKVDHGWWGAQMIEPYVSEKVTWAIRYHQCLRFYADSSVGYEYPDLYVRIYGKDYVPPDYIRQAAEFAKKHKWYMEARLVTVNDLYAFDPNAKVSLDPFIDIIGRHFKQPKEGLGYDGSPTAHMWRTMMFPDQPL